MNSWLSIGINVCSPCCPSECSTLSISLTQNHYIITTTTSTTTIVAFHIQTVNKCNPFTCWITTNREHTNSEIVQFIRCCWQFPVWAVVQNSIKNSCLNYLSTYTNTNTITNDWWSGFHAMHFRSGANLHSHQEFCHNIWIGFCIYKMLFQIHTNTKEFHFISFIEAIFKFNLK